MIEVKRRANINLKELEFELEGYEDGMTDYSKNQLGKGFPYISYGGSFNIEQDDVIEFKLHNDQFLPWIEMRFRDKTQKSFDELFPIDNSTISVFIRSLSEEYWPIRMDFKIFNFKPHMNKKGGSDVIYDCMGILDIDYLYYKKFWSYRGTSFETIDRVCKDAGLGLSTNISNSNDEMVWINKGDNFLNFIEDVTKNSFINKNTFIFTYIDFYYNINYIDIEKQLQSSSEHETDQNIKAIDANTDSDPIKLKLTNNDDYITTNMYIDTFNIENSSTSVNLREGYSVVNNYYNKTENLYSHNKIESISSTGRGDKVVMKDLPGKNNGLLKNCTNYKYTGKMDLDNCHENYLYSEVNNNLNLKFSQKLKMVITLKQVNYSLYRFQNVLVELYKGGIVENEGTGDNSEILNRKLSGEWLITAINYTYSKTKGPVQKITLIKRELSANYEKRID